ncbi:MAG: hypothetical protein VB859_20855 [Planctomycetaceae bacterium]
MKRIFLPLALISLLILAGAFLLGLMIEDAARRSLSYQVDYHMWTALAGLLFATLVHGLVLTYFLGTGRWAEETVRVYGLDIELYTASRDSKRRIMATIVGGFVLLVVAGSLGAAADPASPVGFSGVLGLSASTLHLLAATIALLTNAWIYLMEYDALDRNARLIEEIMSEVRRIRDERGLDNN